MKSFRAGYVGLVGLPNAGKSTLVNALVGEKISIVTEKPQTTRQRITGVVTKEDFQAILVDAPGFIRSDLGLNKFLSDESHSVMEDVNALVFLFQLDVSSPEKFEELIQVAQKSKKPCICVITKIDRPERHRILVLQDLIEKAGLTVIKGSALKNIGEIKTQLFDWVKSVLPETPGPLMDPELYTTENVRDICSEIIREKCFEVLHQEIPFGSAVHILKFDETNPDLVKIYAEIWVPRESHQKIVVGRKAQVIKTIGSWARRDIEKVVGSKVFLDLHVKLKKNWSKDDHVMKELGYVVL